MADNGIEKDLQHTIDEHIKMKIESATKAYDNAIIFYKEQNQNIWNYNKVLALTILAATIGILGFLYGQSMPSFEQKVLNDMTNKVNEKFKDENIQKMIREAATTLTREQIDNENLGILELIYSINQMEKDVEAIRMVYKVINDTNYPYKKIQKWAKESYKEQRKVMEDYGANETTWSYDEKCGIDSTLLRSGQKDKIFERLTNIIKERNYAGRASCIWILWDQKNISMKEKLNLIYETLLQDQNLWVIYIACSKVETIAKLQKDYLLETDEYIKWLEKNKDGIK